MTLKFLLIMAGCYYLYFIDFLRIIKLLYAHEDEEAPLGPCRSLSKADTGTASPGRLFRHLSGVTSF